MPNRPSANALSNRCDLYRYVPQQDVDAGEDNVNHYPTPFATNVRCSVQLITTEQMMYDDGRRPTTYNRFHVYFDQDYALELKTLIVWTDSGGPPRNMQVDGARDGAGKGRLSEIHASERMNS